MSFPAYQSYRDSGVEWLGAVPSHWDVRRLKEIAEAFPSNVDKKAYENEEPVRLCNYTDVYYNDKITAGMSFMEATATREQIERFELRSGDVIITKDSETAEDIAIAAFVPEDLPGVVCGYHLSMVRARAAYSGAFLKRFFDSRFARANFAVRANGLTRVGLGQYAVDNVPVPCPPMDEQLAIATFLDRETARIDALIEEQQRLIELLKEKRQAVISHAVTEGLDPTAPMKDSGVEWLGEVPAHWQVKKLGYALIVPPCYGVLVPDFDPVGVPMLRITDMTKVDIDVSSLVTISPELSEQYRRTLLQTGDLALSVVGTIGQAIVADDRLAGVNLSRAVALLRFGSDCHAEFGRWWFQSIGFQTYVDLTCVGTAQRVLNMDDVSALRIAVPPLDEQNAIIGHLQRKIAEIDDLAETAHSAVVLLAERRSALISAAVTGKIDLRGVVEPTLKPEPEPA